MKNVCTLFLFIFFSVTVVNVYAQNGTGSLPPGNSPSPLSMSGWNLENNPKVNNPSQEAGVISYEIEIDSLGNLLSVKVLKQTVSNTLAEKCFNEIHKMNFVKNADTTTGASTSKGTITFVFRVN